MILEIQNQVSILNLNSYSKACMIFNFTFSKSKKSSTLKISNSKFYNFTELQLKILVLQRCIDKNS